MPIRALILFLAAIPLTAAADPVADLKKGQPADVAALIDRFVDCNHWGGEEPYDKARRKEIEKAITELRCTRLDADEAKLLKKYPGKPAVRKALHDARESAF